MSGHSHYATIKRQKESKDAARGKIFSKHARAIAIAVKTGGGPNPDGNYKLRVAVEAARADNMPKDNITRAIASGQGGGAVEEVTYEGFGPGNVAVMILAATDNRNRTGQEIKNLFEKGGGRFGGPGSVAFNFEPKGFILVAKKGDIDEQMLSIIDSGAEDITESEDGLEVYTDPTRLFEVKSALETKGMASLRAELIQRPKTNVEVAPSDSEKVINFLDLIDEHDDVQKVFTNAHFTQ